MYKLSGSASNTMYVSFVCEDWFSLGYVISHKIGATESLFLITLLLLSLISINENV